MWLFADLVRTGMFLAGIALLTMVLLRRYYRRHGRRRSTRNSSRGNNKPVSRSPESLRSLSTAPTDVLRWHVEMYETAREMKAELDTKMRLLQSLTAQARQEAERLEQILARIELSRETWPDHAPPDGPASELPCFTDRKADIFALADRGATAADIAQQLETPVGDVELILSLRGAR